jgi:5,6-dimethylbenzimidazole synthase
MDDRSDFSPAERSVLYRAIALRRDVRAEFLPDAIPDDVLTRVLDAAHHAPSVGLSQPWRFIVVRDLAKRRAIHDAFTEASDEAAAEYAPADAEHYRSLRLAGILDAPVNICVVCDDDPERGRRLGRATMPETSRYSTVCAIQNLWLAARVEGLGVGWVSIIKPQALRQRLGIPERLTVVAYLCVGYVSKFATIADLERDGWEQRVAVADVVDFEYYGGKVPEEEHV